MSDNIDNLVLEQLRAIRGEMARMAEDMRGLRTEMMSVRHHVRGLELDRIEKRLELVDDK